MFTAHQRAMFAAHLRDAGIQRDTYGYIRRTTQNYRHFEFLRNAQIYRLHTSVIAESMQTLHAGPQAVGNDLTDLYAVYEEHDAERYFSSSVYSLTGQEAHKCEHCDAVVWGYLSYVRPLCCEVCDECRSDYTYCESCEEYTDGNFTYTVNGDVCDGCIEYYSYCENCDQYRHQDDPCECSENCMCEAEHQHFTFPANGDGTITNDERLHVTLPTGEIPERGISQIADLLFKELYHYSTDEVTDHSEEVYGYRYNHSQRRSHYSVYYRYPRNQRLSIGCIYDALTLTGSEWQTRQGNFTRRLSSTLYKAYQLKLPKEVITNIGNIAKQQMGKSTEFDVEFTRNLNLPAKAFYHEDSCWWQSYSYSRCALKNWGGIGMRTFDGDTVTGRAWIQPLNADLEPTHDIDTATAFIVYNGYGDLEGYAPARILSHLTGHTYKKVRFSAPDAQYVNSEQGYLVSSADVLADTSTVEFSYDTHKRF